MRFLSPLFVKRFKQFLQIVLRLIKTYILWFSVFVICSSIFIPILERIGFNNLAHSFMSLFSGSCHQVAHRSFFIWDCQLPVCCRCLGVYIGVVLAHDIRIAISSIWVPIVILLLLFFIRVMEIYLLMPYSRFFTLLCGFLTGFSIFVLLDRLEQKYSN